jgi:hypothetical protein
MALPLGNRLRTHLQNIVPLRSTNFQGMDVQGGYRNGHQQPAYPHQQPAAPAASSYGLDYTAANGGGPELRQGSATYSPSMQSSAIRIPNEPMWIRVLLNCF